MGGWIILAILAALVFFAITIYNRLVAGRNRFKNAFAQIDVQLTRRHDLIPNLVETAKGYIKHERETLEAVINARNAAVSGLKAADPSDPDAMKKLAPRALWWFRWGALLTFLTGLSLFYQVGAHSNPAGMPVIWMGVLAGTLMFLNVWLVIWPKQQIVLGMKAGDGPAAAARCGPAGPPCGSCRSGSGRWYRRALSRHGRERCRIHRRAPSAAAQSRWLCRTLP